MLKTADGGLWTLPQVDELISRGHHVVAILPAVMGESGRLRRELHHRGVAVVDSPFNFRFTPRPATLVALWRLRRLIRSIRPDVVYYHLYASALAARISTLGLPLRRVHMVAGPLYLDSPLIRQVERVLTRLDHVTIGGSDFTSDRYLALGRTADRTPSIPYGVDIAQFAPPTPAQRAGARADLGVSASTFVAIMVAYVYAPKRSVHRGRGIKGHDVLLSAWRSFCGRYPDCLLVLVGSGFDAAGEAHRQQLQRRYRVGQDPSVAWFDSAPDVRRYYAAADVSVSPSLSENHGAALEAGALGLPSIVSDAGALPETIDARCGWLVARDDPQALADALTQAYAEFVDGHLAERGALARARVVARFDRRHAAACVAEVLEQAAMSGREVM